MSDPLSGAALERRLRELAAFTDVPERMTRLSLSPAHARATQWLRGLFEAAGMATRIDALGTLVGRFAPPGCGDKTLLIGSHTDTVRDAGIYDGNLGVVAGLAVVEAFKRLGVAPPCALEILAFADEEGVRFPSTLTGSRAVAGAFDPGALDQRDKDGVSRRDALRTFGAASPDAAAIASLAVDPASILGYVEVHIEQGPVLEAANAPLGVVTAINGATRGEIFLTGFAGHAGTLPMTMRRDALAAAAEAILAIEARGRAEPDLVATVGVIDLPAAAINVVPGQARMTLDVRSPSDETRARAVADIRAAVAAIAAARGVRADFELEHDVAATPCDAALSDRLEAAARALGAAPPRLSSGAGHDAMSFRGVTPLAMLFVRCKGGVSHNALEFAGAADMELAARTLFNLVSSFA